MKNQDLLRRISWDDDESFLSRVIEPNSQKGDDNPNFDFSLVLTVRNTTLSELAVAIMAAWGLTETVPDSTENKIAVVILALFSASPLNIRKFSSEAASDIVALIETDEFGDQYISVDRVSEMALVNPAIETFIQMFQKKKVLDACLDGRIYASGKIVSKIKLY